MLSGARYFCHGVLWLCFCCALAPGQALASLAGVSADVIGEPIAQFRFSGNVKTRESFILLESKLAVGQIITIERLNYAMQQLRDTDLFKEIAFQTERLENGEITLHIIVEERFYWLLLPRLSRNSDGDIKAGGRLTINNLQGANHSLDILAQQEQESDGDDSKELRIRYKLPNYKRYYHLAWQLKHEISNITDEDFENVVTTDFFSFSVARDWYLEDFSTPLTLATTIAVENRDLDQPFPDEIETREAGMFNRLGLSLLYNDVHRERYRRFGDFYGASIAQGLEGLGSDYDSTIVEFGVNSFNRLNFYDNFNYRVVLEFANNSPFNYPMYGIGGASNVRGLESVDDRGNARFFANFDAVFAYRKHPGIAHTLFFDVGNVYDDFDSIDLADTHYTVGTGFRWKIEYFVKTNLILDYGYDIVEGEGKLYGGTSLNF
jgi:outer membrane protein insertion porin family